KMLKDLSMRLADILREYKEPVPMVREDRGTEVAVRTGVSSTSRLSGGEGDIVSRGAHSGSRETSEFSVFVSYSHMDEVWKDRLVKHLEVLNWEVALEVWDDRRIDAGDDWLPTIKAAIRRARVAVLLISAD